MAHMTASEIDQWVRYNSPINMTGLGQAMVDFSSGSLSAVLTDLADKLAAEVNAENNRRDEAEALIPVIDLVLDTAVTRLINSIRRTRPTSTAKCQLGYHSNPPKARYLVDGTYSCQRCLPHARIEKPDVEKITGPLDMKVWYRTTAGKGSRNIVEAAKKAPLVAK